jgi:hypothetical protein
MPPKYVNPPLLPPLLPLKKENKIKKIMPIIVTTGGN